MKYQALTTEQRVEILDEIYDLNLQDLLALAREKCVKGTGAKTMILERARQEKEALLKWGKKDAGKELVIRFLDGQTKEQS
jgi:hypothetical protein